MVQQQRAEERERRAAEARARQRQQEAVEGRAGWEEAEPTHPPSPPDHYPHRAHSPTALTAEDVGVTLHFGAGAFRRMFGGDSAGGSGGPRAAPVQRHVSAPTMRESEVKGKLARFLAGMRAYERQQAAAREGWGDAGGGSQQQQQQPQQQLPPALSEFIAWAGDLLAGEEGAGRGGASNSSGRGAGAASMEAAARRYVGGASAGTARGSEQTERTRRGSPSLLQPLADDEEEDRCCICLEAIGDAALFDVLGDPVQTACNHRFHAVCFARHMEASQQDPWCPMCRSPNLAVRFLGC
mmetsp:Transcript_67465/g.140610  ORF Transcript_67465/g.140610 Transcript_67465/m.140610 type:complete len:297 (+) Transcript_67465:3-893(+)